METKRLELRKLSKHYSINAVEVYIAYIKYTDIEVGEIIIDMSGEIAYSVETAFAGRGYATEMLKAAKEYAMEQRKLKLFLRIRPENNASKKVASRNGFKKVGEKEKFEIWKL